MPKILFKVSNVVNNFLIFAIHTYALMKQVFILLLVVMIFHVPSSYAQNEGTQAYEKGDYSTAIKIWEASASDEKGSYDLFINLGNAYTQVDNLAQARLHFERALKIKPKGKEALNNIQYILSQMEDEVIPVEPFFLYKWWQSLALSFSTGTWFVVNLLFFVMTIGMAYEYLLGKTIKQRSRILPIGGILLSLTILTFFLGLSRKHHLQRTDTAVILEKTPLKLGADEISESVSNLQAGYKVILLDQIGDWYKVSKLDKEQGWIQKKSFEII